MMITNIHDGFLVLIITTAKTTIPTIMIAIPAGNAEKLDTFENSKGTTI
jgi:hypothetical protein